MKQKAEKGELKNFSQDKLVVEASATVKYYTIATPGAVNGVK